MNKLAKQATYEADAALFMVAGSSWQEDDDEALSVLQDYDGPVIAVINKIDRLPAGKSHEAIAQKLLERYPFTKVITLSAKTGAHCAVLAQEIQALLPESSALYSTDQITTHTESFMSTEILRAKILEYLHEEIPYVCTITLDKFEQKEQWTEIHAVIWVRNASQKPVVIGKKGAMLKRIGIEARQAMESLLSKKVVLKTWVKVGVAPEEEGSEDISF